MKPLRFLTLVVLAALLWGSGFSQRSAQSQEGRQDLTPEQKRRLEQLRTLGYLSGETEAPEHTGVTIYEKGRACDGLNFYTSGHGCEAILMDMEGNVLHTWSNVGKGLWRRGARGPRFVGQPTSSKYWRRGYLLEGGDIVVIFTNQGVARLDRESNIVWASKGFGAHHDLDFAPNGDIYVASRNAVLLPRVHPTQPVLEDCVSILDPAGREKTSVSLIRAFENSKMYRDMWENRAVPYGDLMHLNTVELMADGRVMTSLRLMHAIAILDMDVEEIVWAYQGRFRGQHEPTILPNGNLLLFNNNWTREDSLHGESTVMEYEFPSMDLAWEYRGTSEHPFYSGGCGTAQRLENGNTLITESMTGRVFEVTQDKEIVWEFINPHRTGENGELTAAVMDMDRLDPDFVADWLEE